MRCVRRKRVRTGSTSTSTSTTARVCRLLSRVQAPRSHSRPHPYALPISLPRHRRCPTSKGKKRNQPREWEAAQDDLLSTYEATGCGRTGARNSNADCMVSRLKVMFPDDGHFFMRAPRRKVSRALIWPQSYYVSARTKIVCFPRERGADAIPSVFTELARSTGCPTPAANASDSTQRFSNVHEYDHAMSASRCRRLRSVLYEDHELWKRHCKPRSPSGPGHR